MRSVLVLYTRRTSIFELVGLQCLPPEESGGTLIYDQLEFNPMLGKIEEAKKQVRTNSLHAESPTYAALREGWPGAFRGRLRYA